MPEASNDNAPRQKLVCFEQGHFDSALGAIEEAVDELGLLAEAIDDSRARCHHLVSLLALVSKVRWTLEGERMSAPGVSHG